VTTYIIRRLIQSIFVMLLTTMIVFSIMRLLPGDPILMYLSQDDFSIISEEEIVDLRHEYGLDKSLPSQYIDWIAGVLRFDLGDSIFLGTTVKEEIADALPISFYLGFITFVLANLIGIPVGVICAVRRGKWIDTVLTLLANIGITAPVFWLGILMIYFFGLYLGWLPFQGYTSPFDNFWLSTRMIIMPVICLMVFPLSGIVRQTRSAMLEIIRQDYMRTAWAKGLTESTIIMRHGVRNGITPVVTMVGLTIPHIFGGQVLIETVFNIPGMGRLAVEALFSQDYAIVQGIVLIIAAVVVMANLLVDISYGWIDPRVRYE